MPRVGDKHFPYTKAGYAAAAKAKKGKGITRAVRSAVPVETIKVVGQLWKAAGRKLYIRRSIQVCQI